MPLLPHGRGSPAPLAKHSPHTSERTLAAARTKLYLSHRDQLRPLPGPSLSSLPSWNVA